MVFSISIFSIRTRATQVCNTTQRRNFQLRLYTSNMWHKGVIILLNQRLLIPLKTIEIKIVFDVLHFLVFSYPRTFEVGLYTPLAIYKEVIPSV